MVEITPGLTEELAEQLAVIGPWREPEGHTSLYKTAYIELRGHSQDSPDIIRSFIYGTATIKKFDNSVKLRETKHTDILKSLCKMLIAMQKKGMLSVSIPHDDYSELVEIECNRICARYQNSDQWETIYASE
jgi:hypothetical protein